MPNTGKNIWQAKIDWKLLIMRRIDVFKLFTKSSGTGVRVSMVVNDASYNIKEIEVDPSWMNDLGEDYRKYRERWKEASNFHLFDFPLFLELETSYACNYRCPKCPRQAIGHAKKGGFLNDILIDKIFEEAQKHGMPSVTFSHGGEPLLRKDLPELISKAKKAGILDIMFHTNGFLLTRELSCKLIDSGLTKINFSLDAATEQVYNKVRVGGDYQKVVSNLDNFLQIKKMIGKSYPRVRVSFVVSEENKHEQEKFYELWKGRVNIISYQKCYDFIKMRSQDPHGLEKIPVLNGYQCSQLWQLMTITYTGDVLICEHDYEHKYVLGNLKKNTLYECWNSETMNYFRKLHMENRCYEIPICKRCVCSVKQEISD